jgi:tetratricopeptide (TPR) repeat protein
MKTHGSAPDTIHPMALTRKAKLGISIFLVMLVLAGSFLIYLIGMLQHMYRDVAINSEVGLLIQQHSYDKARIRLLANPEYAKTDRGIRRQIQALGGLGRLVDAEAILSENSKFEDSVYGQETIGELRMLQGRYTEAADAFDKQYKSRPFAKATLGSKALAMWRGKIPGSLDIANESCDEIGHYNARGFYVIAMHSPPKSPKRLKTLQRAMEFSPDDFIIHAYLTEARLQRNISAELDALDAAVDASYYPGARWERAKKAFINAVKTHHITGKAAILAEKYASESKPTH